MKQRQWPNTLLTLNYVYTTYLLTMSCLTYSTAIALRK